MEVSTFQKCIFYNIILHRTIHFFGSPKYYRYQQTIKLGRPQIVGREGEGREEEEQTIKLYYTRNGHI